MKRILLAVLVLIGLQTQAQINLCDSMTASGAQTQLVLQVNNANTFIDYWCTNSTCGSLLGEDSMSLTHNVYNSNLHDTIVTCITYGMGATTTCCVTWIWDANMWLKMSMQQPYFCCDSITYWTDQSQGLTVGLDTTNMVHNPDSMTVYWGVCTGFAGAGTCYAGNGISDYFPQVTTSDTIKVTYDVYIYENGVAEVCSMEDWLVFDGTNWVLFNNTTTSINEITFNKINDNKIYDLLGREVTQIEIGQMYIRNNKKYIRVK
tara:strand:- start:3 stop:788 length:786 start_codon:yes stop_codon:yes gene_type:complete